MTMNNSDTTIEIIEATLDDLERVVPLFDSYRQFYRQTSDIDGARAFLKARIMEQSSVIFLAVLHEQNATKAVGFTQLYPSFSSTTMQRIWILNDLFVTPEAPKHGVGTLLLERARQFAVETHAKRLTLQTAIDNYTAQRLYEAQGWERETEFFAYNLPIKRT